MWMWVCRSISLESFVLLIGLKSLVLFCRNFSHTRANLAIIFRSSGFPFSQKKSIHFFSWISMLIIYFAVWIAKLLKEEEEPSTHNKISLKYIQCAHAQVYFTNELLLNFFHVQCESAHTQRERGKSIHETFLFRLLLGLRSMNLIRSFLLHLKAIQFKSNWIRSNLFIFYFAFLEVLSIKRCWCWWRWRWRWL